MLIFHNSYSKNRVNENNKPKPTSPTCGSNFYNNNFNYFPKCLGILPQLLFMKSPQ
ncbi:hypothetical protein Hanom_Chr04g00317831 [Helianthus anomalus]